MKCKNHPLTEATARFVFPASDIDHNVTVLACNFCALEAVRTGIVPEGDILALPERPRP